MFTGIVREVGLVASLTGGADGVRLEIDAPETARTTVTGDYVALNGVCLTAVAVADGRIAFDAVPETLARTSLERLSVGARINIEPALRVGDSMGGHNVQGH